MEPNDLKTRLAGVLGIPAEDEAAAEAIVAAVEKLQRAETARTAGREHEDRVAHLMSIAGMSREGALQAIASQDTEKKRQEAEAAAKAKPAPTPEPATTQPPTKNPQGGRR